MSWTLLSRQSGEKNSKDVALLDRNSLSSDEGGTPALDGQWNFAGAPWTVQVDQLTKDNAFTRIALPLAEESLCAEGASSELEYAFDILESLDAQVSESKQTVEYRVETDSYRLVGFAPAANPKSIRCIRLAQSTDGSNWNFVELKAESGSLPNSSEKEDCLMPRIDGCQRFASKSDASGRLIAELISSDKDLQEIRDHWTQLGWTVTEPDDNRTEEMNSMLDFHAIKNSAEELNEHRRVLLCTHGESTIAVVVQDPVAKGEQSLLLIRLTPK